jgi:hypothetical protein
MGLNNVLQRLSNSVNNAQYEVASQDEAALKDEAVSQVEADLHFEAAKQ